MPREMSINISMQNSSGHRNLVYMIISILSIVTFLPSSCRFLMKQLKIVVALKTTILIVTRNELDRVLSYKENLGFSSIGCSLKSKHIILSYYGCPIGPMDGVSIFGILFDTDWHDGYILFNSRFFCG